MAEAGTANQSSSAPKRPWQGLETLSHERQTTTDRTSVSQVQPPDGDNAALTKPCGDIAENAPAASSPDLATLNQSIQNIHLSHQKESGASRHESVARLASNIPQEAQKDLHQSSGSQALDALPEQCKGSQPRYEQLPYKLSGDSGSHNRDTYPSKQDSSSQYEATQQGKLDVAPREPRYSERREHSLDFSDEFHLHVTSGGHSDVSTAPAQRDSTTGSSSPLGPRTRVVPEDDNSKHRLEHSLLSPTLEPQTSQIVGFAPGQISGGPSAYPSSTQHSSSLPQQQEHILTQSGQRMHSQGSSKRGTFAQIVTNPAHIPGAGRTSSQRDPRQRDNHKPSGPSHPSGGGSQK